MTPTVGADTVLPVGERQHWIAVFGVLLFLASDVMLFAGFFAAHFVLRGRAATWPPAGVRLNTWSAGSGTVVLAASSATMVAAHRSFVARRGATQRWLAVTLALGAAFTANQLVDDARLGFGPADHAYGAIYFALTGLHTLHVVAGIGAIGLLSWRIAAPPGGSRSSAARLAGADAAFDGTALFWHLVDAVWLGLFTVIWVLR